MKNLFLPLETTTILLLLLLSTLTTTNAASPVYDVWGEPLLSTKTYYMVPYDYSDVGGGLFWQQEPVGSCQPLYVTQKVDNTDFGQPIYFVNLNPAQTEILESTQLNIVFGTFWPICPEWAREWRVVADSATGIQYIQLASGSDRSATLFTIEDVEDGGYKIRYCPPNGNNAECGDLGIVSVDDSGRRWLGVNGNNPLKFVFETQPYSLKNARRSMPAYYKLGKSYLARVLSLFG